MINDYTNGLDEPRVPVSDIKPGSICRFGVDDDMIVLVLANVASTYRTDFSDKTPARTLILMGCFNEANTWGQNLVFQNQVNLNEHFTLIYESEDDDNWSYL
jgi:hypothetical protein